jgi:serine O-acetyltransferase
VIHPYTAGERFTVHQGATIGLGHAMPGHPEIQDPVFGDDVQIHTNAIVFGGIRVGSRVEIGAGAVVNKDVPDDCLVVGNPMRIIDRSGSARKAAAAEK